MVKVLFTQIIFIAVFFSSFSFPQEQQKISSKKSELDKIRSEIKTLEIEIDKKNKKEKETYTVVDNYNKQNFLLNKLINNLHAEEKRIERQIRNNESKISALSKEIKILKKNYANYIVTIYKYGKENKLEELLNSKSIGQAIRRYKYLQRFSEQRIKDLTELKNKINELEIAKNDLKKEKKAKLKVVRLKVGEEKELVVKLNERKKILGKIKNDKVQLKAELDAKKSAEIKIRDLITKLIAEAERKRKEAEVLKNKNAVASSGIVDESNAENSPDLSGNYDVDLSTENFASFEVLKGRLNWPVKGGKIIRSVGENRNAKLKTVTLNYGVDIRIPKSEPVKAVADGVVSAIEFIPGYGSVIIITHKGDYRTVYSHLSEIYVNEGDHVKLGTLIAKVGESLEGYILHFEIWNARNNQNPEVWLVKR